MNSKKVGVPYFAAVPFQISCHMSIDIPTLWHLTTSLCERGKAASGGRPPVWRWPFTPWGRLWKHSRKQREKLRVRPHGERSSPGRKKAKCLAYCSSIKQERCSRDPWKGLQCHPLRQKPLQWTSSKTVVLKLSIPHTTSENISEVVIYPRWSEFLFRGLFIPTQEPTLYR